MNPASSNISVDTAEIPRAEFSPDERAIIWHPLNISKIWKKDFKTFVKEARKVHGNKYNYVEKTFIDYNHYTDIICPKHGVFKMRPHNHVSSQHQGCPMCYNERRGETLFLYN